MNLFENVLRCLFGALLVAASVPASAQEAPPSARVEFTSQPRGATVVVDGSVRGATPLALFDLVPGRHQVKFQLAGYADCDRVIAVDAGAFVPCHVVLEPLKGLLLLQSEPAGCTITVDGQASGVTPRLVTGLDAKDRHRVTYRKAGYRPATFDIAFDGRTPLVRHETLVLDSGIVAVSTEPAGATVTVNGLVRAEKTPMTLVAVPKGRATVKLHLDGYEDEVRELSIAAGDRQTLSVLLKGLPGTLTVSSVPDGARIYLDGEPRGKAPLTVRGLKPGSYAVRAELEGWGEMTRQVVLPNGAAAREEFRLSNKLGRLEVRTDPVGATLFVDGRRLGMTRSSAPNAVHSDVFAIEDLAEGEHVLVVRADGYAETTRHPVVTAKKTLAVDVRLKRIFIPNVELVTDQETYRGVYRKTTDAYYTIEVRPGIEQSFPRASVRRFTLLDPAEAGGAK